MVSLLELLLQLLYSALQDARKQKHKRQKRESLLSHQLSIGMSEEQTRKVHLVSRGAGP
jgi:hypothetical protein